MPLKSCHLHFMAYACLLKIWKAQVYKAQPQQQELVQRGVGVGGFFPTQWEQVWSWTTVPPVDSQLKCFSVAGRVVLNIYPCNTPNPVRQRTASKCGACPLERLAALLSQLKQLGLLCCLCLSLRAWVSILLLSSAPTGITLDVWGRMRRAFSLYILVAISNSGRSRTIGARCIICIIPYPTF